MSSYRATVSVEDGTLHVSRPLTAPERVTDLVDSIVWAVIEGGGQLTSVTVGFETSEESGTPIGDGITGTSSAPLLASPVDDEDDDEDVVAVPVPALQP